MAAKRRSDRLDVVTHVCALVALWELDTSTLAPNDRPWGECSDGEGGKGGVRWCVCVGGGI